MELKVSPKELGSALHVCGAGDLVELKTGEGKLEALTYYELQWSRVSLPVEVVKHGRVVVKRELLTALLNSLTQPTTLKIKGTKLIVSDTVNGSYQLMTLAGQIPVPELTPQHQSFELSSSFLYSFNRAFLAGELMGGGYGISKAYVISSDRIRIFRSGIDGFADCTPFTIPTDLTKSFSGILSKAETAFLLVSHQHIVLRCHCLGVDYEIGGSTVVQQFPDISSIVTKTSGLTNAVDLDKDQLKEVIGRLQKVYKPQFVDFVLGPESCSVKCVTEDGNATVGITASFPEEKVVRVQTQHTVDFLGRVTSPQVNLRWSDEIVLWTEIGKPLSLITTPGRVN